MRGVYERRLNRRCLVDAGRIPDAATLWGQFLAEDRVIEGVVNADYEAVITLALRGQAGQTREIEVVIDTGYNGFLSLPPALVAELGIPVVGPSTRTM